MPIMRDPLSAAMFAIGGLLLAQPAGAAPVERVSVSSDEVQGNARSYFASVSDNGRFVAFCSLADNLVPGDTNGIADTFVRDRLNGTTERVSVSSDEVQANGDSCGFRWYISGTAISADGRFVVFSSSADNLVPNDTNGIVRDTRDTFVRDRLAGTTERVSVNSQEQQADLGGDAVSISAGGRFVVFSSQSENLTPRGDIGAFVRDRQLGTTEWAGGYGLLSASRRFLVNLVTDDYDGDIDWYHVGLFDRLNRKAEQVGGEFESANVFLSISADGRFVTTYAGFEEELYVVDRKSGVRERIDDFEDPATSYNMALSAGGRFVVFSGGPGVTDVFVRDRLTRTTEKVTAEPSTFPRLDDDGHGGLLSISADGRFVAFDSNAGGLVPGDTNNELDVFVSDFVREPRALPDGRNDLVAVFGANGIWQHLDNGNWTKIDNARAAIMAAGDLDGSIRDEVIAGFAGRGLFARDNRIGIWWKLHDSVPIRLVAGDFDGNGLDDLAADFGSQGLWIRVNKKPWAEVHASATKGLKVGDLDGDGKDELVADFGTAGLFARYSNVAPFVKIRNGATQGLATGDLDGNGQDDILVDLGGNGLWAYYNNAAPWVKLDPRSPTSLLATDLDSDGKEDVVADFGNAGLWVRYNNSGAFHRLHASPSQAVAAGGFN